MGSRSRGSSPPTASRCGAAPTCRAALHLHGLLLPTAPIARIARVWLAWIPPPMAAPPLPLPPPPPAAAAAAPSHLLLHLPAHQVVTPWDVTGGADGKIDYNKLVEQVGCMLQLVLPPSSPFGCNAVHSQSPRCKCPCTATPPIRL